MTRRLEMQNNWFWQKIGLTLILQILLLLIGNQCKQGKEKRSFGGLLTEVMLLQLS